jgi:hypothetical protein
MDEKKKKNNPSSENNFTAQKEEADKINRQKGDFLFQSLRRDVFFLKKEKQNLNDEKFKEKDVITYKQL